MGTEMAAADPSATPAEQIQRKLVCYEERNGVALITLDDLPGNAYTYEMMTQLDAAILRARFSPDVHVLVLTGAGEKFFCAGANIKMLQTSDPYFKFNFCLHANETLMRLPHTPMLVIAALNGHTTGGGLEVAMAGDILVARKGAGKIGLPESTLGVLPGTSGTQRFPKLVGINRAIELMATGELLSFEDAQAIGLLNHVWEAESSDAFIDMVVAYAQKFCPPNAAAGSIGCIKLAARAGQGIPEELGFLLEGQLMRRQFEKDDAREGLTAFVEKRKPSFTGR